MDERFMQRFNAQVEYDKLFETTKWSQEIPFINFPSDVEVKVIPPFAGASIRFLVKKNDKVLSVYLDCYSTLGAVSEPYWEIYPYEGDTYRCMLNETDELLERLVEELDSEGEGLL